MTTRRQDNGNRINASTPKYGRYHHDVRPDMSYTPYGTVHLECRRNSDHWLQYAAMRRTEEQYAALYCGTLYINGQMYGLMKSDKVRGIMEHRGILPTAWPTVDTEAAVIIQKPYDIIEIKKLSAANLAVLPLMPEYNEVVRVAKDLTAQKLGKWVYYGDNRWLNPHTGETHRIMTKGGTYEAVDQMQGRQG